MPPARRTPSVPPIAPLALAAVLPIVALLVIRGPHLPFDGTKLGSDYAFQLPNLLVGYYFFHNNGPWALPWFNPAQCGGIPFYADPQSSYFSLLQVASFFVSPFHAVRVTFVVFALVGQLGMAALLRRRFQVSLAGSLVGGALFALNGFYSRRMLIGHVIVHAFMLVPWLALLVTRGAGEPSPSRRGELTRVVGAGLLIAYMIQSGAANFLPQSLASVVLLALALAAARGGAVWGALVRLAAGCGLALALSATKLASMAALIGQFPRDLYPLPGFTGLFRTALVALQSLAWGGDDGLLPYLVNTPLLIDAHELDYTVSLVAIALSLWLAASAVRALRRGGLSRDRLLALAGIALLLVVPLLLNWYQPTWNALLKRTPILGKSSNLLRWFMLYVPFAAAAAAVGFDKLVWLRKHSAAASVAVVGLAVLQLALGAWASPSAETYDGSKIAAAFEAARGRAAAPPVTAVVVARDAKGHPEVTPDRNDAVADGHSQMLCYQPLFGYRLEGFPIAPLHSGPVTRLQDGHANLKNPACYLFPAENDCSPGAHFRDTELDALEAFAAYKPFPFRVSRAQRAADAINVAALGAVVAALAYLAACALRRRARRPGPAPRA